MTQFVTSPGPFLRNPLAETKRAMRDYTIGLLGLFAFSTGFHWLTHGMVYGIKAIGMMVTSLVITLLADMLVAALRYQSKDGRMGPYMIHAVKKNYSYVTAVLMTLTLPIGTPYFVYSHNLPAGCDLYLKSHYALVGPFNCSAHHAANLLSPGIPVTLAIFKGVSRGEFPFLCAGRRRRIHRGGRRLLGWDGEARDLWPRFRNHDHFHGLEWRAILILLME